MNRDKKLVLVIEDDDSSREALAVMLEAEGYEMETAGEGAEGYACAHEMQPDVIVVDLGLPGVDGKSLIQIIRADPELNTTPILVVTGKRLSDDHSALHLGADGYFTKPIEFDQLINRIAELTGRAA